MQRSRDSHVAIAILAENLFTAIKKERKDDIEKYLCLGADPNYVLLNGITPFHLASGCSHSYEFSKMILDYDGNPNVRNTEGLTPLHIATLWGQLECIKLLAENGADINITDNEGNDLRWFSRENGSAECMTLVEQLVTQTQQSINQDKKHAESRNLRNKENRTPKLNRDRENNSNKNPISIRSPLHGQCDDSWIMKQRGSARRRYRNDKSSRDNSPAKSPLIGPCTGAYPKTGKCLSPQSNFVTTQCSPVGGVVSKKLGPVCNSNGCSGSSVVDISTSCRANFCQFICTTPCHRILHSPNEWPASKSCAKFTSNDDYLHQDSETIFDTTDKCIGTSISFPSEQKLMEVETDNVACQVTILQENKCQNLETQTDRHETVSGDSQDLILADDRSVKLDDSKVTSNCASEYPNSTSSSETMSEFLEGCNRFIHNDSKGLDVSSPDHCVSFYIKKSSCVQSPTTTPKQTSPSVSPRTQYGNVCNNNTFPNKTKNEKNILNNETGNGKECLACTTPTSSPVSTRKMLLSTKVPLSPSEMMRFYGKNVFAKLSSANTSNIEKVGKCDKSNTAVISAVNEKNTRTTELSPDNTKKAIPDSAVNKRKTNTISENMSDNTKDDITFTFSESTVPVEVSDAAINESSVFESPKVGQSPPEVSQSSISLRRFAARPSDQNGTETPKKGAFTSQNKNKALQCLPSFDKVSTVTTNSRLHSTALNAANIEFDEIDDASFDISIIRADPTHDCVTFPTSLSQGVSNSQEDQSKELSTNSQTSDTSSQSTIIYNWKTFWKDESIPQSVKSKRRRKCKKPSATSESSSDEKITVKELQNLSDLEIRDRLISHGCNPGPISACRDVYLKKLEKFMNDSRTKVPTDQQGNEVTSQQTVIEDPKFSTELHGIIFGCSFPTSVYDDDDVIRHQFDQPDPNLQWREGTMKNSFTYLLLDPRVTDKLPLRIRHISEQEAFKSFVGAIFYVGKGKQSRPYSHFHEALQTNRALYKLNPSLKVQHIHDIWNTGHGVISLHVFQSVIACEAYTREAAMIEAIGLQHLTNRKRGDYYGVASTWDTQRKRLYGSFLVKKAMDVLMVEGERQIRPSNLKSNDARQWTGCNAPLPPASG